MSIPYIGKKTGKSTLSDIYYNLRFMLIFFISFSTF